METHLYGIYTIMIDATAIAVTITANNKLVWAYDNDNFLFTPVVDAAANDYSAVIITKVNVYHMIYNNTKTEYPLTPVNGPRMIGERTGAGDAPVGRVDDSVMILDRANLDYYNQGARYHKSAAPTTHVNVGNIPPKVGGPLNISGGSFNVNDRLIVSAKDWLSKQVVVNNVT